jgi:SAM-dependent methyltransferase
VPETYFDEWVAAHYERLWPELFDPALIDSTVSLLAALTTTGAALEFGIGTGRIALPLSRRNIRVHGIELSPAMAARLRANPDSTGVDVTLGDFATTTVDASFDTVYLLRNTITNLTTQDEQVDAFANAADQLRPGGCFVVENYVPELRRLPPGETIRVFTATPDHVGYEQYETATQTATSHHYWTIDGRLTTFSSPHRYVWPSELDLMARLCGLTLRERFADWHRTPFSSDSRNHISVWEKTSDSHREH